MHTYIHLCIIHTCIQISAKTSVVGQDLYIHIYKYILLVKMHINMYMYMYLYMIICTYTYIGQSKRHMPNHQREK